VVERIYIVVGTQSGSSDGSAEGRSGGSLDMPVDRGKYLSPSLHVLCYHAYYS
jgi:hypothetical protein